MFHRTKQRFEALMALIDEALAAEPQPAAPPHPHDRTVSLRVPRRGGSVAPREMHCLCPVRSPGAAPRRDHVAR